MTVSPTSVHEAYYVMNNRSLSLGVWAAEEWIWEFQSI
jgi:hypothetical protein